MPFWDDFNRGLGARANLEATPVATGTNGGWSWVHDGAIAGGITVETGNYARCANAGLPTLYSIDVGGQDQYVEFKILNVTNATGAFVVCRALDKDNWVGIRSGFGSANGQIEVYHRNAGTMNAVYQSSASAAAVNNIIRLEISGAKAWTVKKNGAVVTSGTYSGTFPVSTRCGLVARSTVFEPWIDDFKADQIISGISGSFDATLVPTLVMAATGTVSAAGVTGTLAATIAPALVLSASGTVAGPVTGTLAATITPTLVCAASGTVQDPVSGSLGATLDIVLAFLARESAAPLTNRDPGDGGPVKKRRQQIIILDEAEEEALEEAGEQIAEKTWPVRKKRRKFAREVAEEVAQAAGIFAEVEQIYRVIMPATVGVFEAGSQPVDLALQEALARVIQAGEIEARRRAEDEEDEDLLLLAT